MSRKSPFAPRSHTSFEAVKASIKQMIADAEPAARVQGVVIVGGNATASDEETHVMVTINGKNSALSDALLVGIREYLAHRDNGAKSLQYERGYAPTSKGQQEVYELVFVVDMTAPCIK